MRTVTENSVNWLNSVHHLRMFQDLKFQMEVLGKSLFPDQEQQAEPSLHHPLPAILMLGQDTVLAFSFIFPDTLFS